MKTSHLAAALVVAAALVLAPSLGAAPAGSSAIPPLPKILNNARYVYVTAFDGDAFDPNLLPADRAAIAAVESALRKWGRFIVVYRPADADMILVVESRPSEDVLAVFDAHGWPGRNYLWRMMGPGGLQANETPLVTNFRRAFEKAAH